MDDSFMKAAKAFLRELPNNNPPARILALASAMQASEPRKSQPAARWEDQLRALLASGENIASVRKWLLQEMSTYKPGPLFSDLTTFEQAFLVDCFAAWKAWADRRDSLD
jgi:hypothetical protein